MADVDIYPPNYHQYIATQHRVSNWVEHTYSQTQLSTKPRRPSSKRSPSAESILNTRSSTSGHGKATRKRSSARRRSSSEVIEQPPVTPAVALVSSSLFVCALLPSILTISAFVVLLTLASMDRGEQNERAPKIARVEE